MAAIKYLLAILAALVAGALIAVQSRLNGELGLALEDGVSAALYSFTSGWLLIALVTLFSKKARAGLKRILLLVKTGQVPFWMILGGAFGGFLVMTQGLAAGALGIALFTVAVVAGQSISAIAIDSKGWFGVTKRKLNLSRVIGAVIVVVGVGLAAEGPEPSTIAFLALPFIAGLGLGFQQAANGGVRIHAESAIAATFLNFTIGSAFLVIVKLVSLPIIGIPSTLPSSWWLYVGGFAGVLFIATQVIVVAKIGVLGLGLLLGTGQLIGALLIDLVAPLPNQSVALLQLLGVVFALVGAIVVNVRR